jgi:hypothetical protein
VSCDCDCDRPAVYRPKIQRARKVHSCYECAGPIALGDEHEYVFGIWDGDPDSFRTCKACLQLRSWVANVIDCQPCHGDLVENATEELRNTSGPWTPEVRQQWWQGARLWVLAKRRQRGARVARQLRKAGEVEA